MKAYISKRAAQAAERIAARWHQEADHPNTFALEFLAMVELIEASRSLGSPYPTRAHPGLKRVLLHKSSCHVYFEVNERRQVIQILHIWDARRNRPPKL